MQVLVWGLLLALCGDLRTHASTQLNEHKVPYIQNIVLYPDKHSWCKTTEIKQIVAYPGCDSVEIDNNVCVGACFSYSIPKTSPSAPGEVITPYCDSCQPSLYTWKEVKLKCRDESEEDEEGVMELIKKVQVISNCSCSSCQEQKGANAHDQHSELNNDDVPELMSLMMHHKKAHNEEKNIEENEANEEIPLNTQILPQISENIINVDEKEEKESTKNEPEDEILEVLHVNQDSKETYLVPGPHHSLVLKPNHLPEHHDRKEGDTGHQNHQEDEQVPSLLHNQFKIHDDEEFPDQLAVESRKEFDGKSPEVLTVPDLIYKIWNVTSPAPLKTEKESTTEIVTEITTAKVHLHHHHHHHHNVHKNDKGNVNHHSSPQHQHSNRNEEEHQGVKIVDVADHHLKPAIEGAQLSYMVKDTEFNPQDRKQEKAVKR